jgi:hypothetical protein
MVLTYIAQYVFLKLSLTIQFLRLISTTWEQTVLYLIASITTSIGTTHFFLYLYFCGPPQDYAINLFTHPQKCLSQKTDSIFQYIQVSSSVIFDVIVVGLPLRHILINQTMNIRTKATVSFILLLFVGGLAASIVRLAFLQDVYDMLVIQRVGVGPLVFFIEGALFVIGGCLGTLRPLVSKTLDNVPKVYASTEKTEVSIISTNTSLGSEWNKTPALPPPDE